MTMTKVKLFKNCNFYHLNKIVYIHSQWEGVTAHLTVPPNPLDSPLRVCVPTLGTPLYASCANPVSAFGLAGGDSLHE